MRVKYYLANIPKLKIAEFLREEDWSGTIYDAVGFSSWGIEESVVVELFNILPEHIRRLDANIAWLLHEYKEKEALKLVDNDLTPRTIYAYQT